MSKDRKRTRNLVSQGDKFIILAEFVPLPGHNLGNFEKFLNDYTQKKTELPEAVTQTGFHAVCGVGALFSCWTLTVGTLRISDSKRLINSSRGLRSMFQMP